MNVGDNSAAQLVSFVERIERLDEEKQGIADDAKEVYAEAKSAGFDPSVMRKCIRLRKIPAADREAAEAEIDTYMAALDKMDEQALAKSKADGA